MLIIAVTWLLGLVLKSYNHIMRPCYVYFILCMLGGWGHRTNAVFGFAMCCVSLLMCPLVLYFSYTCIVNFIVSAYPFFIVSKDFTEVKHTLAL